MAEPAVLQEFNDQKLNLTTPGHHQKLPKIQRASRQQVRSKAEQRKSPQNLPIIKPSVASPAEPPQSAGSKSGSVPQKDDFALQIEQKLKLVLENVNQGQIEEGSEDSEDVDFQELIEQNKQKLKHQKQKNEKTDNKGNLQNRQQKKQVKRKSKSIKTNAKNDNSIYEKRMKEYRDGLNENKYIQRKKDILAQRQEVIEKAKARHQKEDTPAKGSDKDIKQAGNEMVHNKDSINNVPYSNNVHSNKSVPRPKAPRSAFKHKQSFKNVAKEVERASRVHQQEPKSANLFDNIHNLLLNPQKIRAASEVKRNANSTIQVLQEKIKLINEKLGLSDDFDKKGTSAEVEQKTALDWKRLQYNRGSNFRCHYDSNFQKQVDRISYLQQKSNDYLSRLVNHQKTLVELTLIKKLRPGAGGNTE